MFNTIYVLLGLLFIKHWLIDFVFQTDSEVKNKGIYGNLAGLAHSIKHGAATGVIMLLFVYSPYDAVILGLFDSVLHYHIDWIKMRFGNRDIATKAFWAQLGLDQLAHAFCYLILVSLIF
jgi:hypothetical protein